MLPLRFLSQVMAIQTGLRTIVGPSPKTLFWWGWISFANSLSSRQRRWQSTATAEGPLSQAWWRQKTRRWQLPYLGQEHTIFLVGIRLRCAVSTLTSDRKRAHQRRLLEVALAYIMLIRLKLRFFCCTELRMSGFQCGRQRLFLKNFKLVASQSK